VLDAFAVASLRPDDNIEWHAQLRCTATSSVRRFENAHGPVLAIP